ncbi:MAG: superoxide dismutase [Candidatus Melainabacteria bacterium HGW-Melainabacteria-1]|nr:MAG: superoxide dismutase [Candidatus Melainabacteria bacterium HGW-Melainabacteria-1]
MLGDFPSLPPLPYAYDALEPFYQRDNLEIHHAKHHQTYTDKLNEAVQKAGLEGRTIEDILCHLDAIPADVRQPVINHGGGYYNHTFFWESMAPSGEQAKGELADAINLHFGSVDAFKDAFSAKALNHFGSGWAWLVLNQNGELEVTDTHDQICPLSLGHKPLLTIDVWEHAYYLKYKNARAEWIKAFWNIVNWDKANARYLQARV